MSLIVQNESGHVEIRRKSGGFRLYRNGKPFFVRGAGGFSHLELLREYGGNSVRTWGSDQTRLALPEIRSSGLTFCAGLWMSPQRHGFDYSDSEAVAQQEETLLAEVAEFSKEPNLLLWGIGNELDLESRDPVVWDAVERIARRIKELDPSHPTMTVIASPRPTTLSEVAKRCPSLDLLGINSYADMNKVIPALDGIKWEKPYVVTEWGSNGSWEVDTTPWGARIEPNSSQKAAQMRDRYRMIVSDSERCLGSYAFFWGAKQEVTPTWFNLLDTEGRLFEGVEALSAMWGGGKQVSELTPLVESLTVEGSSNFVYLGKGETARAVLALSRCDSEQVHVQWELLRESEASFVGGDTEPPLDKLTTRFARQENPCCVEFDVPKEIGPYRLFVYATADDLFKASANIPIYVR